MSDYEAVGLALRVVWQGQVGCPSCWAVVASLQERGYWPSMRTAPNAVTWYDEEGRPTFVCPTHGEFIRP